MTARSALLASLVALAVAASARAAGNPPNYAKDVKPFLAKYCLDCHNDARAKSGYSVETLASLTKAVKRGALVVPGKPDASRLLLVLDGDGKAMPPQNKPQPRADEVAKVRDWVKAGTQDDSAGAADAQRDVANADKPKGGREVARKEDDDDRGRGDRRKHGRE